MFARVVCAVQLLIVLFGRRRSLALLNLALRQQLAMYRRTRPKPAVRWSDRLFWVGLRQAWPSWKSALVVVRPATVIEWHRRGFAWYWTRRSRRTSGRPRVHAELRRLVRGMANANPLWGAPRLHGELLKLGFDVSERTVSRLMPYRRRPPSQTWRTFLRNHLGSIVAVDFFTVPTITCRLLFVLVVLAHDRRRILHVNATAHPTSAWTRHQLREVPSVTDPPRSREGYASPAVSRHDRHGPHRGGPRTRRAAPSLRTPRGLNDRRRAASGTTPTCDDSGGVPDVLDMTPDGVRRPDARRLSRPTAPAVHDFGSSRYGATSELSPTRFWRRTASRWASAEAQPPLIA